MIVDNTVFSASIGIIGGADGPTAILVTGDLHVFALIAAVLAVVVVAVIIILKRRGKKK